GEGSGTPIEPHYTLSSQSKILPTAADEPASLLRDDSQGKAFSTVTSLDAGQDMENIIKTSALPHESTPRVTSLDADEGNEPASLSRDDRQVEAFPTVSRLDAKQDRENIAKTSALPHESSPRVTSLDADKDKDAPITRGIMEIKDELGADKSTELGSNDTKEMVNVLNSMEAANILTSGGAAASVSPGDVLLTVGVPTVSGSFPTVSAIFTTASVRLSKQLARDSKIARLHAEEELKIMIEGLDKSNEVVAKHLREYEQAEADLSVGEKIELISELVKYQDHNAKILKYQAQQSKPLSKKD
nr:hypothetical protein [Tanacetum cinerariifolium]